jgi:hypothetical protein
LLLVGTSELTLDQLAVRAGQSLNPGQRVRFPDMLKHAAMQHYGTPGIASAEKHIEVWPLYVFLL